MTLVPGMLVDKYRIAHLLGDGGMGAVYLAEHVVLGRRAAIKVLHPHITSHAEIVQRFINEAKGAASLEHRNIIHVLDCGQLPGTVLERWPPGGGEQNEIRADFHVISCVYASRPGMGRVRFYGGGLRRNIFAGIFFNLRLVFST